MILSGSYGVVGMYHGIMCSLESYINKQSHKNHEDIIAQIQAYFMHTKQALVTKYFSTDSPVPNLH